jgi:hypothetical protein
VNEMDFKSRSKDYAKRIEKQLEVLLNQKTRFLDYS